MIPEKDHTASEGVVEHESVPDCGGARRATKELIASLLQSDNPCRQKLGRILREDFDRFGVRYVNIDQYKDYLENGYSTEQSSAFAAAGEATGFANQSFQKFFKEHTADWRGLVTKETDWERSTEGMHWNDAFTKMLSECRTEALVDATTVGSIREKTLRLFQRKILDRLRDQLNDRRGRNRLPLQYSPFNIWLCTDDADLTPELLRKTLGSGSGESFPLTEKQLTALHTFFHAPESLKRKDLGALRAMMADRPNHDFGIRGDQYHVALVFDPSVLKEPLPSGGDRPVRLWSDMTGEPADHILAAIPLMHNRELTEKIVALSKASGTRSHPVIDSKGVVRFPDVRMNILEDHLPHEGSLED